MSEKKIKVTVEYDGKSESFEGYSLIASLIQLTKDAPVQSVVDLNYGRLSRGDHLSAVVKAISAANKALQDVPETIRNQLLLHAVQEGLNGGLKDRG